MKNATSTERAAVFLACLLLAGCAPKGFESIGKWREACIRQGGEPLWIKTNDGGSYLCLSTSILIQVKP